MACDHSRNYVINSRDTEFGTRRRRECANCGHRWSTIEVEIGEGTRDVDPWLEYRKMAVAKYLKAQLKEVNASMKKR